MFEGFLSMITCAREEIIVNRNIFKKVADINKVKRRLFIIKIDL